MLLILLIISYMCIWPIEMLGALIICLSHDRSNICLIRLRLKILSWPNMKLFLLLCVRLFIYLLGALARVCLDSQNWNCNYTKLKTTKLNFKNLNSNVWMHKYSKISINLIFSAFYLVGGFEILWSITKDSQVPQVGHQSFAFVMHGLLYGFWFFDNYYKDVM